MNDTTSKQKSVSFVAGGNMITNMAGGLEGQQLWLDGMENRTNAENACTVHVP